MLDTVYLGGFLLSVSTACVLVRGFLLLGGHDGDGWLLGRIEDGRALLMKVKGGRVGERK